MEEREYPQEGASPAEKKHALFTAQKELLDRFLEHGAITQAQYDKSLGDLAEKMGFAPEKIQKQMPT